MNFDPILDLYDDQVFSEFGGVNPSITDSATYTFLGAEKMVDTFHGEADGCFLYSRHWNPSNKYLSDALAAQVGGIGIAPGANINYVTGHAIFEATHGTAPKYAGLDQVNPGSVIISGSMMLKYMGWIEAHDLIWKGLEKSIIL